MRDPTSVSKFLSYILRHKPEAIGLELDEGGWAEIDELIECSREAGREIDRERLIEAVEAGTKRRFSFSATGDRIRANYGHSIPVDLNLNPLEPPETLCHGTAESSLPSIRADGLEPRGRQWVHLNPDTPEGRRTAREVGARHGSPVVLTIRTDACEGPFFRSTEGIWLVDFAPPSAIDFPDEPH